VVNPQIWNNNNIGENNHIKLVLLTYLKYMADCGYNMIEQTLIHKKLKHILENFVMEKYLHYCKLLNNFFIG